MQEGVHRRLESERMPYLYTLAVVASGFALAAAARAEENGLPLAAPVPGGVAVVCVGRAPDPAPRVVFDGQRVRVARVGDAWHAVVGLPLALKPGAHELSVLEGEKSAHTVRFDVRPHDYEAQHVTLADRRQVEPGPADRLRIARAQTLLQQRAAAASQRRGHRRAPGDPDRRAGGGHRDRDRRLFL